MYITYLITWLYECMQIQLPLVFSKNFIINISIFELFIGSCYLFIAFLAVRFFLTGIISYEKASVRTSFIHNYENAKQSNSSIKSKKGSD